MDILGRLPFFCGVFFFVIAGKRREGNGREGMSSMLAGVFVNGNGNLVIEE